MVRDKADNVGALIVVLWLAVTHASGGQAATCAPPSPSATSYTASGCDAIVPGGTFDTGAAAYAAVLHAANSGSITVTAPVTLRSSGDESTGGYVESGGRIDFGDSGSSVTTRGAHSNGAHVFGDGSIAGRVSLTTYGERSHAAFVDFGGTMTLRDSTIVTYGPQAGGLIVATGSISLLGTSSVTTAGDDAPGLGQSSDGSSIVVDAGGGRTSVRTTGTGSPGALVESPGSMVLRNVDVRTEGGASPGLAATVAGASIDAAGTTVTTLGDAAIGADATGSGTLTLNAGAITTSGAGAHALVASGADSRITAERAQVTTQGASAHGIVLRDGGGIVMRNAAVRALGAAADALRVTGGTPSAPMRAEFAGTTLASSQGAAIAVQDGSARVLVAGGGASGPALLAVDSIARSSDLELTASGATLYGASAMRGPASAGATVRVTLVDGATWWITGDSTLTSLNSAGSVAGFARVPDGAFHSLTARQFHGDAATLVLNTALGGDRSASDRLVIDGGAATGTTGVRIANAGGRGALTFDGIRVIEAINGGIAPETAFRLSGRAVAGPYEYRLYRGSLTAPGDGNWYLRSQRPPKPPLPPAPSPGPTPSPSPSPSPSPEPAPGPTPTPTPQYRPEVAAYLANATAARMMFLHSLHDRLNSLPADPAAASDEAGRDAWLRLVGRSTNSAASGDEYSARIRSVLLQGGSDLVHRRLMSDDDRLLFGAMAGYGYVHSDGSAADSDEHAAGTVNGYSVGMYATWFANARSRLGPYVDSWLQFGWMDKHVRGDDLPDVGYHTKAWAASVETGWAFPLGVSWRIEPQVQAVWLRQLGIDVTEPNGTELTKGASSNIITRVGVRLSREIDAGGGRRFAPYAAFNWWHDQSNLVIAFSDVSLPQMFPTNRYEVRLGLNAAFARRWSAWGDISGQWGAQAYSQYGVRFNARYIW
ncbi:autotransporter outer membrane beta-barrel domain-containing protein [Caballeronia sp. LZ019]|uniref:autotransporter family protein n=1 Tax=Caballeronia sp. LZ019 TaxID=3038555 RepID=UPI00285D1B4E|nr:autotransporter outer membrane beta-barrel domain-containing protein [Caballeronia sp. LZ019]MDR5810206.1 autotransporter outer membrane beta-barrel domain-containing protein [Caballeronia sp. LZ019]